MNERRIIYAIGVSFFVAYSLTIVPFPAMLEEYRPDFVAMTVFFWLISVPNWIGVGVAWLSGLLLDTLHGSVLGQHALALIVIAYITLKFHLRIRVFTIWQELLTLAILLGVYHFLLFWSDGMINQAVSFDWSHATQLLASVALWPAWVLFLNGVARSTR